MPASLTPPRGDSSRPKAPAGLSGPNASRSDPSPAGVPAILAVVGLAGAGKSEAARLLVDRYGYCAVYFGGIVVGEVQRRGLPLQPANERAVREELRAAEGMDAIARRSIRPIRDHLDSGEKVVIDGLYSTAELARLRAEPGWDVVTLAVHAPRWLRKRRLRDRAVRPLTAQEVDERDWFELTNLDKAPPIVLADLHVVNDGGADQLGENIYKSIKCFMDES
ncbi:MAG TPA: AAA family ATPase [Streptosporangiaceae bacterium]|nr:AAA family ATPase [Streptosporangiaceae bacterium]